MTVYVATINGKGIAAFSAKDVTAAEAWVRDPVFCDDLMVLATAGVPLWDGATDIHVRPALPGEEAKWRTSRAKAVRLGDIESEDDAWVAFLVALNDPDRRK
jgi:hypothetical protein